MCYNMSMEMMAKFDGVIFEAESLKQLVAKMRKSPLRLTMEEIGGAVGVSRARVGQILKEAGFEGCHEYPELDDPDIYIQRTDWEIAEDLRIKESKVAAARRLLGIRRRKPVDMVSRQKGLSEYMFGHLPGKNFSELVIELSKILPAKQASLIRQFYVYGRFDVVAYTRSYRAKARKKLKSKLDITDDLLLGYIMAGYLI